MNTKHITLLTFFIVQAFLGFAQNTDSSEVFEWYQVEKKAEFPGGNMQMDKFINRSISLPDSAFEKANSGTVIIAFVVEKDGSLSDIHVVNRRLIGFGVEEACLDVIRRMPPWKPATSGGKPIRMSFRKPIRLIFN